MCIDSPDPLEAVPPMDIPVPSSPTSTYSWTPLFERHCGPQQDAPPAPDLKRPRSPSFVQEKRLKTDALRVSFIANKTLVKREAPWWDADMKAQFNLSSDVPLDGVESAISAWVAFACSQTLGQELSVQEEQMHGDLVASAKMKELDAWGKFKVFSPVNPSSLSKNSVDSRWALTWKMVDGVKSVKAHLC